MISVETTDIGHINSTSIVSAENGKFVLQRLQKKMDITRLVHNFALYSGTFDSHGWLYPVWIKTCGGEYFYTDECGCSWRMYPFIEGEILNAPLTEEHLFSCGKGLARLHSLLKGIEGEPAAVYPMLHDLAYYYGEYTHIIESGTAGEKRDKELEKMISDNIGVITESMPDEKAVVHGDTKLSNIIFRNGNVVGCLDMDTVMRGSLLEDVADCVRSCCIVNGRFDGDAARRLINGYADGSGLSAESLLGTLPAVFNKICFELGLRYYTDSISTEKRFSEKYPGYRRERAESVLALKWDK